jgi:hypothetical protein
MSSDFFEGTHLDLGNLNSKQFGQGPHMIC